MLKILTTLLVLGGTGVPTAYAKGQLIWQSRQPTATLTNGERCYATVRLIGGKRVDNPWECPAVHIHNYVPLTWDEGVYINPYALKHF